MSMRLSESRLVGALPCMDMPISDFNLANVTQQSSLLVYISVYLPFQCLGLLQNRFRSEITY
jgi:hypothetical protein